MFVLVFAVAVTLAYLWLHLAFGRVYVIVAPDPWMDKLGREGIELVVFPLAWIAGLLLKWGSSRISALRTSLIAPFLPLLAAGVLALIGLLLALAWTVQRRGWAWHGGRLRCSSPLPATLAASSIPG